jgi:hypothetical protein
MNFVRRDDVDNDAIDQLQAMFPGMEIKFAGQEGTDLPEEVKKAMEEFDKKTMKDLVEGRCTDCGEIFVDEHWPDNWLPEGSAFFKDHKGDPIAIQCPKCNKAEKSEDDTM